MKRTTAKILSVILALCLLIGCVPAQVAAYAKDALQDIGIADETETLTGALAPDEFYGCRKYKQGLTNKTEHFYSAEDYWAGIADSTKTGTFLLYCNSEIPSNVSIPAGKTMILPYSRADLKGNAEGTTTTAITRESWSDEATYLYATLTIPAGKTLTVNGTLIVGAISCYPDRSSQGHTSGAYSQIDCQGTLAISDSGVVDVYGLIKGTGNTVVNNGGTLKIPFLVNDFDGGTNSTSLYDAGVFPFNLYALNNIQSNTVLNYGCSVIGKGKIYFASMTSYTATDAPLIGTDEGVLRMSPGSTVSTSYDASKTVNLTIDNANLGDFGVTNITTTGNIAAGGVSLSYSNYNFDSTQYVLGVPYNFTATVASGTFTVPYKYRMMPGFSLTIAEGAAMNVTGEVQITDGWEQPALSLKRYPTSAQLHEAGFSQCGNLIVNGTLNVASGATFVGAVQTTSASGGTVVTAADSVLSGTFTSGAESPDKNADNRVSYDLSAKVCMGDNIVNMVPGTTYTAYSAENWTLPSYTMTVLGTPTTIDINETMQGKFTDGTYTPEAPITVVEVEDSGVLVDNSSNVVYNLPADISDLSDYLTASDNDATLTVNTVDGNVCTGAELVVSKDGAVKATYTIVIIGDTQCDGTCTGMDATVISAIAAGLLNASNTSEAVLLAADCNRDGQVNQDDVLCAISAGLSVGSYFNTSGEIVNGNIIELTPEEPEA